jgi:hypothetical protein
MVMQFVKNGTRTNKNGWICISINGKPYERGLAHGQLLATEIKESLNIYKFNLYDSHGLEMDFFIQLSNYVFKRPTEDNFPEFFEELKGIADGANVPLDDLILLNNSASLAYALLKLSDYIDNMPQEFRDKYGKLSANLGSSQEGGKRGVGADKCSAFIAVGSYTADGKIVCAHNTFDEFIGGQLFRVIVDIHPEVGNRIIYQGAPGYISSQTDFFVTSAGFIGTENTLGGFNQFAPKDPITCRIRKCMQYAMTLDDYVDFLTHNNSGDYANAWLFGDINTNEIMRIELGLNYVNTERLTDGYFIGFNAAYDPRIRNLECSNTGFDDIRRHQGSRKVRLEELMEYHKGNINVEIAEQIIGDHYDVYLKEENKCSRTVCSHYDLDNRAFMSQSDRPLPFQPRGTVDGKVCDTTLAKQMAFKGRWGSSCGTPFNANKFFKEHIQWKRLLSYIHDRPSQPWTLLKCEDMIKRNKSTRRRSTKNTKLKTSKNYQK